MTDDEQAEAETPKRMPGRPKGATKKKRPAIKRELPPVHQGLRDDEPERLENQFEFTPYEAHDALHIDHDVIRSIRDEYGYALMWVVHEAAGKPFPDLVNARRRNGFAEVMRGHFGGVLDHMADRDGRIAKEGLVLMGRPVQIEMK
jgi:hypothetical protein